jgi:hypothetical protein
MAGGGSVSASLLEGEQRQLMHGHDAAADDDNDDEECICVIHTSRWMCMCIKCMSNNNADSRLRVV